MGNALLGGFLAVALAIALGVLALRRKVRRRTAFYREALMGALSGIEEEGPKSLNGCDSLLLPQIRRDFPDFDPELVKTYAREALEKQLSGRQALTIYNVVFARYDRSPIQKSIGMQAALSYREAGVTQQKRYCLRYSYVVSGSTGTVAFNCPNCGSPLGYGAAVCEYCGSRVTGVLHTAWRFTEIREG